jgi:hypothetical protein
MAKSSVFRRFITALKRHWRAELPHIVPLSEPRGSLAKSSSFDAGVIPATGQHVYFGFQTSWKEAGYFTINLVVADLAQQESTTLAGSWHRISHFLGDTRPRHDKWWHLCKVSDDSFLPEQRERMREMRLSLRRGNWTAVSYDDENAVIAAAVADVTRDVVTALKAIGVSASGA